ncbi:MAG TPA: GGDEF domain-containing protein [Burkholderiales bacterium]|nr:GGDEF domain-containing protein [Burkholderiales bacterium]
MGTATPPPPQIAGASERPPGMGALPLRDTDLETAELRDFSRTVAEIEWLLVILVLLYHVFQARAADNTVAIYAGLIVYSAIIICFHYLNFMRRQGRWSLAVETWIMIVFITYVLLYTGRLDSPLLNLYLLPIVTSALTLGQKATLLNVGLIAACYLFLGYSTNVTFVSIITAGDFAADLAPMLLVAYITTMLSQDIMNAMARIRLISETDGLTHAYNMRAFNSIARRECALAHRYNRTFSLLMVDSDNLKKVNDTHGHEAGDRLIKLVAKCIRDDLRATDVIARYGGDEFMCLLPETAGDPAAMVAERIRRRIEQTALDAGQDAVPTTVSIGVATYPGHGNDFDTLAKNVDRALYASKAQGRNRVTVFPEK